MLVQFGNNRIQKFIHQKFIHLLSSNYFQIGQACSPITYTNFKGIQGHYRATKNLKPSLPFLIGLKCGLSRALLNGKVSKKRFLPGREVFLLQTARRRILEPGVIG